MTALNVQDVDLKPKRALYFDRIGNPYLARQTAEFYGQALDSIGNLGLPVGIHAVAR